jgi:hypothetical protein
VVGFRRYEANRHGCERANWLTTAMAIQQAVTDCWREPLEDDATVVVLAVA